MGRQMRGVLLLILTTMLWGCSFVAQRTSVDEVDPFTFNTGRMVSAFLTLLIVVIIVDLTQSKKSGAEGLLKAAVRTPGDRRKMITGGLLCGLALFAGIACMQLGIMTTGAGKTGFITALYIIEVPILGVLIGRKPRRILWICVILAIVGLWLLAVQPGASLALQKGDVILLIGSVFFAFQIMLIDHFVQQVNPLVLTLCQFAVCAVLFPLCMFLFEDPSMPAVAGNIVPILYAGVMSSAVGFTLQTIAQKDVDPTVASLIMSLEGVFAVIGAWVIINEHMTGRELAGCALMFAAIIITQLPEKNRTGAES